MKAPQRLVALASKRLLHSGFDTCERIEHQAIRAMEGADWKGARKLLHLRLRMHLPPTPDERKVIERVLALIDEAEAKGIGPGPLLPPSGDMPT